MKTLGQNWVEINTWRAAATTRPMWWRVCPSGFRTTWRRTNPRAPDRSWCGLEEANMRPSSRAMGNNCPSRWWHDPSRPDRRPFAN